MNKLKLVIAVMLLALFLTGCWDRIEIEQRGFVIGVAIDFPAENEEGSNHSDKAKTLYNVTYQFVNPQALKSGGSQDEGKGKQAYFNVTAQGDSMQIISREVAARVSRTPFFEHLKLIIVSDDVARSPFFADVLDFFLRYSEMRRETKVMIARDGAQKVLNVNPPSEKLPVMYISSVSENDRKTARILPESRIGDVMEHLLKQESFVLPSISGFKTEVDLAGSAVFDGSNNRLVGFLSGEETMGLNLLRGKTHEGVLRIPVGDQMAIYEIIHANRKIQADFQDPENIVFHVKIQSEGTITESFADLDFLEEDTIKMLEEHTAKEIIRLTKQVIQKTQEQYKKDVIGLGNHLKEEHYTFWKKVKDNWDKNENLFASSKINVEAKIKIRRIGTVNRTER